MADHGTLPQPQRLHAVTLGAREARLAYQRGEITHEERMSRLEALCRPQSAAQVIWGLMTRWFRTITQRLPSIAE